MTAPQYDATIPAVAHGGRFNPDPPAFDVVHSTEGPMSPGNARALAVNWFGQPKSEGGAGTSTTGIVDPVESIRMLDEHTIPYHVGPVGNGLSTGDEHCGSVNLTPEQWMSERGQAMLDRAAKIKAQRAISRGWSLADCRWLTLTEVARKTVRGFCFTAGVLILTRRGLVPVENVAVGDEVWTHRDRWRPVISVMSREADVVKVVGQGHDGIRVTPEHPFLNRRAEIIHVRDDSCPSGRNRARRFAKQDWTPASDLVGSHWMTPTFGGVEEPPLIAGTSLTPEMMWVIGLWVADGYCSSDGRAHFFVANHQLEEFRERICASGLNLSSYELPSPDGGACTRLRISSRPLAAWLHEYFGSLATGKTLPAWLLFAHEKYRSSFLAGYVAGDGWQHPRYRYNEPSTVSRSLAIGLKLLASSLGYGTSLYAIAARTGAINGREVRGRGGWKVRIQEIDGPRCQFAAMDGRLLGKVKSVTPDGHAEVFNISVAEDESYVADGLVVHNCTHNDVRLALGGTTHTDPGRNFPYVWYMGRIRYWFQVLTGAIPEGDAVTPEDIDAIAKKTADKVWAYGLTGELSAPEPAGALLVRARLGWALVRDLLPGVSARAVSTVAALGELLGRPAADVDEAALAAELAPLLPSTVGTLSDDTLSAIARAVADEQGHRLGRTEIWPAPVDPAPAESGA
jgi:intein/homing endonuclease